MVFCKGAAKKLLTCRLSQHYSFSMLKQRFYVKKKKKKYKQEQVPWTKVLFSSIIFPSQEQSDLPQLLSVRCLFSLEAPNFTRPNLQCLELSPRHKNLFVFLKLPSVMTFLIKLPYYNWKFPLLTEDYYLSPPRLSLLGLTSSNSTYSILIKPSFCFSVAYYIVSLNSFPSLPLQNFLLWECFPLSKWFRIVLVFLWALPLVG